MDILAEMPKFPERKVCLYFSYYLLNPLSAREAQIHLQFWNLTSTFLLSAYTHYLIIPSQFETQSSLIKKAEDTEADTAEQSAIKLRAQQQTSNALTVTDQPTANGIPPEAQLGPVKMPSMSNEVRCMSAVIFLS